MQLRLLAAEAGSRARRARRFDLRGAENLQLEQRRARIARRADVSRMPKRVLATRTAQRVVRRASRRPHVVGAAKTVPQERAGNAGRAVLRDRQSVDARRVDANLLLEPGGLVGRRVRAERDATARPPRERTRRRASGSNSRSPARMRRAPPDSSSASTLASMRPLSLLQSAAHDAASPPARSVAAVCSNVAVAAGVDCSRDRRIAPSILNVARRCGPLYFDPYTLSSMGDW